MNSVLDIKITEKAESLKLPAFFIFRKVVRNFGENETKKGFNKSLKPLCFLVENIGVEPMTSCMPCKRSSQLS